MCPAYKRAVRIADSPNLSVIINIYLNSDHTAAFVSAPAATPLGPIYFDESKPRISRKMVGRKIRPIAKPVDFPNDLANLRLKRISITKLTKG